MLYSGIGEPYDHRTGTRPRRQELLLSVRSARRPRSSRTRNSTRSWARPATALSFDDFNGENFDHSGLGFFGGGYIVGGSGAAPPIGGRDVPDGHAVMGLRMEARKPSSGTTASVDFNTQGSVYANRENYLDLDPTYKDSLGRPLLRMTYNGTENDHKMSRYLLSKVEAVIKAMNPISYELRPRPKNFTIVPYQSTHNTGGTIMGDQSAQQRGQSVSRSPGTRTICSSSAHPSSRSSTATIRPAPVGALAYWTVGQDRQGLHQEAWSAGAGLVRFKGEIIMSFVLAGVAAGALLLGRHRHSRPMPITARSCSPPAPPATRNGRTALGPSLKNVVGRKSARARRLPLFAAMKRANLTWDRSEPARLSDGPAGQGERQPHAVLRLSQPPDADDVIAYLATFK